AGSGSHPRRFPGHGPRADVATVIAALLDKPGTGTRRLSWSAETAGSPRPCTAFLDHGAGTALSASPSALRLTHAEVRGACPCHLPGVTTKTRSAVMPPPRGIVPFGCPLCQAVVRHPPLSNY